MAVEKDAAPESLEAAEELFGLNVEELLPDETDAGEGDDAPRPDPSAGKEVEGDAAADREGEDQPAKEETVPKKRFDEVYRRAKRADEHAELLDVIEEDPDRARRLLVDRYSEPDRPARQEPVTSTEPAMTNEQVREYWEGEFARDPLGTIAKMLQLAQEEGSKATRTSLNRITVNQFKRDRRRADPLFSKYEKILDRILKDTDPRLVEAFPEQVLERAENMAFGEWARTQRQKIKDSGGTTKLGRERTRETVEDTAPAPDRKAAPKRKPTADEIRISETYNIPIEDVMDESMDDDESAWR